MAHLFQDQVTYYFLFCLRKCRRRGEAGPGGAAGLDGGIQHGWAVYTLHKAPGKQHKPAHEQCSSALELHGTGVTWALWQR